jgi:Protein of unknown function (DUF3631)
VVAGLLGCGERPWVELRKGRPLTEAWLAQQLRRYDIKPRTIRIGEEVGRGYTEQDFMETFKRYIPKSEVEGLKAELAEQTVRESGKEAQAPGEMKADADRGFVEKGS